MFKKTRRSCELGIFICLVASIFVTPIGCNQQSGSAKLVIDWKELTEEIQKRDVKIDVQKAIENNDYRLKGIYEEGLYLPGVKLPNGFRFEQKFGVDPMIHTSDTIESKAQDTYQRAAETYAEKYNQELLQHLEQNGLL